MSTYFSDKTFKFLRALARQLVDQHHATKRQDCTAKQHPLEAPKHRAALPLAPR
mgnify:CR=1 FL=1